MGIGLGFSLLFLLISNLKKFAGSLFFLLVAAGILMGLWFSFPQLSNAIQARFITFQYLDYDKSILIREVMVQKGLRLFKESPWIGVGANRFKRETTPLELPRQLAHLSQETIDARSSHNSYIQFLAEFGLLGAWPDQTHVALDDTDEVG